MPTIGHFLLHSIGGWSLKYHHPPPHALIYDPIKTLNRPLGSRALPMNDAAHSATAESPSGHQRGSHKATLPAREYIYLIWWAATIQTKTWKSWAQQQNLWQEFE